MLTSLLGVVIGIVLFIGILYLVIAVAKRTKTPSYQGQNTKQTNTYFIDFKDIDKPDIKQNAALMEAATVKFETATGYCVASTINDTKLRDLVMKEYQLKPKNVLVTFRQVV